jgi:hypothetical protein
MAGGDRESIGKAWRLREYPFPTEADPVCLVAEFYEDSTGWTPKFAIDPESAQGAFLNAGSVATAALADGSVTDAKLAQDPWHVVGDAGEPALEAGITNLGGDYAPCRFRKIGGVVWIDLAFNRTVANGSPIFTLPAGYRPAYKKEHAANSNGVERVTVLADGTVVTDYMTGNPCIITISFPAEA